MSSKDTAEQLEMCFSSSNVEIMMGEDTNEILTEHFNSLLHRYQKALQAMKGSEFVFDSIDRMFYKFHTTTLDHTKLYIDFPNWIKDKGAKINPKYNDVDVSECSNNCIES